MATITHIVDRDIQDQFTGHISFLTKCGRVVGSRSKKESVVGVDDYWKLRDAGELYCMRCGGTDDDRETIRLSAMIGRMAPSTEERLALIKRVVEIGRNQGADFSFFDAMDTALFEKE